MRNIINKPREQKSTIETGRLILEIRAGELNIYPIADSDIKARALLKELQRIIEIGDFAEVVGRSAA